MMRQLLLVAIVILLPWPGKGQNNNIGATPSQNKTASNSPTVTPVTITPKPTVSPIPNSSKAANSSPTPKRDLERETTDANISIAKYTLGGVAVAGVQILIGIVGMYFIWATLKATQATVKEMQSNTDALIESNNHLAESNRVAREAYNAERRPWLSVEIEINPRDLEEDLLPLFDGTPIWLRARIKNHGSSPAENVSIRFMLVVDGTVDYSVSLSGKFEEKGFEIVDNWNTTVFPSESVARLGHVLVTQNLLESEIAKNPKRGIQIGVFACVDYASRWTEGIRQTCCAYSMEWEYANVVIRHDRIRTPGWGNEKFRLVLERSTAS